ncbi:MAG: nucleotidyltransferase family protein [Anaerolineae bacterium]|jgi:hypothetical protein|nr:nucleotidyltransferase family protein [Anaerolineae bacterium]
MPTASDDYLALWWHGEVRRPEAELIAWARRQRLLPLLGWRADRDGWHLPDALTTAIRRSRLTVAASQALTNQQLRALGETAQSLSMPVVLVKGAAAAEAYPAPWMRPYGDIDLLVDEADAAALLIELRKRGYSDAKGIPGTRHEHLPPLQHIGGGHWVEVHTSLAWIQDQPLFNLRMWADRLCPLSTYPGLAQPNSVDHTLYLIFHGIVQHELERSVQVLADLKFQTESWTCDDWRRLRTQAEETGMVHAVGLAMELAEWFWADRTPEGAESGFPKAPRSLLAAAEHVILDPTSNIPLPHIWRRSPLGSLRGLLPFARALLLGDPAEIHVMGARQRLALCIQRPTYLIRNYGASLWQLLRGDPATRAAWRAQRDLQTWLREA